MGFSEYKPIDLGGSAFRLLRLFKGEGPDIECDVFQTQLSDRNTYEALSYTWGSTEMAKSIKINRRVLGVTKNLYWALWHLRSQDADRILWVDSVCINQGNEKERGHQVQQMGDIYSHADQVIFWLGRETLETLATQALMDSLKQLQEEHIGIAGEGWKLEDKRWIDRWSAVKPILRKQYPDRLEALQWNGLKSLLEHPWFQRIWILQEVANAKDAVVYTGTRFVSAQIFALAPLLTNVRPEPHCQAVLDIMPGQSRKDSWWSQKRDLYTLLVKFNGSKASDERDMIYALLGIYSDACDNNSLRADYTKDAWQVVYDATLFLFDLTDTRYRTMSRFLRNFTTLNIISLSKAAKSKNARNVADFLKRRNEVKITEEVVKAAAGDQESGKEVMSLLLNQRGDEVKITEEVVRVAAGNQESGKDVMALLLKQRGEEVKITEEVVKAAAGNSKSGKEVMSLLLEQRGEEVKIAEEVVRVAAGNLKSGKEVMALLLKQRGDKVKITEEVLKAAAGNQESGKEVMALLLNQRGDEVKITEEVLKAGVGNLKSGKEVMALLLKQRGYEVRITEEVLKVVAGNWKSGTDVMALLLEQRGEEVKITEEVLKVAEQNWRSGNGVMALFLEQRGDEVKTIKEVVRKRSRRAGSMLSRVTVR